jgi:MYXO-CTERM domain-containing protein
LRSRTGSGPRSWPEPAIALVGVVVALTLVRRDELEGQPAAQGLPLLEAA